MTTCDNCNKYVDERSLQFIDNRFICSSCVIDININKGE